MKLRNLVMTLLLCMVVGVFATACFEGDTGPVGPKGDKGDPGDKGDQGPTGDSGDTDSREYSYPFLVNWGKSSGMMSCEDDLLKTTGEFPGPSLTALPATTNVVRFAPANNSLETANGYVGVTCSDDVFDPVPNPDLDGDGMPNLTGYDTPTTGLLFVKTETGMEENTDGSKPATSSEPAVSVKTTKTFSGGMVFADMDTKGGSDEAIQRAQLYHDCSVGTAPSAIAGEWRAVNIVKTTVNTRLSDAGATRGLTENIPNTMVTETTKKVCVRLDSLPGTVKCYVREEIGLESAPAGVALGFKANAGTETIGIYKDGALTAVMPAAATSGDNEGKIGADVTIDKQFIGDENDFRGAKLCNLFVEAATP